MGSLELDDLDLAIVRPGRARKGWCRVPSQEEGPRQAVCGVVLVSLEYYQHLREPCVPARRRPRGHHSLFITRAAASLHTSLRRLLVALASNLQSPLLPPLGADRAFGVWQWAQLGVGLPLTGGGGRGVEDGA